MKQYQRGIRVAIYSFVSGISLILAVQGHFIQFFFFGIFLFLTFYWGYSLTKKED